MKKNKVKVAFVGAGFIGQLCHINNYFLNKNCEIVAIAEVKKKQCNKVADKYSIPNRFYNHTDLLKSNIQFDAVIIVTKRSMTAPIAYDCLKYGKSIFTEKPMALNVNDASKLIKISKKKKLIHKVGYNKIYDDGIQTAKKYLKKIINSNEFGEIIYVRAHRFSGTGYANHSGNIQTNEKSFNSVEWDTCPNWLPLKYYEDYKSYLNVNCHLINLLIFLMGDVPKIKYVNISKHKKETVILDFKNIQTVLETKAYKDNIWDEEIKIFFENGYLKINTPPQQLENVSAAVTIFNRKKSSKLILPIDKWTWSFKNQANAFIEDLKKNKKVVNSSDDSIKDLRVIQSIWKNWTSKR